MKNPGGWTACSEENLFVAGERETRIAGRECAFTAEGRGHIVGGEGIPMFAVRRLQYEEFAIDRIAESEAFFLGAAGDGVEKRLFASVRVLKVPGSAAVGGFVDARLFAFADRYEIDSRRIDRNDAAVIERVAVFHVKALPRFAFVERFQDHSVGA